MLDIANNGPLALEMACRHVHDLVFMDWQMPGMDGLSVTRALRQHEAAQGLPRVPVVALTANAYGIDQALSSQAGCDGHIAKPASKATLLAALARFGPMPQGATAAAQQPGTTATAAAGPDGPAPHPGPVAAPQAGSAAATTSPSSPLDTTAALARLGHDAALLERVLDHAAVFILGWPQAFAAARAQGEPGQALRLAHDLRGIAATIGADALSAAAAQLEAGLRAHGDRPPDAADWAALQRCIHPVIVALSPRQPG